jgi:hypothetical protein
MPKASGSTQTGDRQDGKGSDSSVVPVRRKYNVKGMPEHIKEMARYATLAFDALNRSMFKTYCIAKAKEFGTTEKKIRREISKYRNQVREGKINDERDKFLSKQRASRRWEIQWYNEILYIITNFDSLRKKERKLHIIKLASETNRTVESILKDIKEYRIFRDKYRQELRREKQAIMKQRLASKEIHKEKEGATAEEEGATAEEETPTAEAETPTEDDESITRSVLIV